MSEISDGRHDFDFLFGRWKVRNRRLVARLQGSTEWQEFEATSEARGLPTGLGNEARCMIASKRTIVCWAMGLTQHKNAVANIQEIVNLMLLRGQLGKPGAGLCPVRGHSNVQGNRTMMIWESPPEWFLDKLKSFFGFEPPRHHGVDVVNCIKAMHNEKIKVFFSMGGNFLSATLAR
jgi:anaerobic selenocysteine-containing dehydrogenase